jgi:hypothetical protein
VGDLAQAARTNAWALTALVLAATLLSAHVAMTSLPRPLRHIDLSCVADHLAAIPNNALIAVTAAGVVPYFLPDHRFHDLLGKNDRHIARLAAHAGPPGHNKWDYEYSLSLKPEVIVGAWPAMQHHPLFQASYAHRDTGCRVGQSLHVRRASPAHP